MIINKRRALFMLIVSCIITAYGIAQFFYFHESIFKNFSQKETYLPKSIYNVVLITRGILDIFLFSGLFWVLKIFGEKRWIRYSIIIFYCCKVLNLLLIALLSIYRHSFDDHFFTLIEILGRLNKLGLFYVLFSFLFVRNKMIRRFFLSFTGLMFIAWLISFGGPILYDDFGYSWLLVNDDFLYQLPYTATLVLFVEVFNLSRQRGSGVDIIDATNDPDLDSRLEH